MKKIFATTKNVSRFLNGMAAAEEPIKGRVGMCLVYGQPGTGKTEVCQKYAADNQYPYIRATNIMSNRGLLSKIVAELGEAPAYSSDALFDQAIEQLLIHPRTLIIDEVDYLCRGGIVEILRDLNDITNVAVVLVGMHEVDKKLKRYRHLWDRLSAVVHFETFDFDDVSGLTEQICEVKLSPDAVRLIYERSGGKFRRILVWFARAERMARSSGLDFIELEHLRTCTDGGGQ